MKKLCLTLLITFCSLTAISQPRPFEIDQSFVPTIDYMQKSWTGEYDGYEQNSRMILTMKRTLTLSPDMTYTNEVKGCVKDRYGEFLLRRETGTYLYDVEAHSVIYTVQTDSTLDINVFLQGEQSDYQTHHYYQEGDEMMTVEAVQFTFAAQDDERQWVCFDQQLMSPIDNSQKAVYVMLGHDISSGITTQRVDLLRGSSSVFDLHGRKTDNQRNSVAIVNGRKIFRK